MLLKCDSGPGFQRCGRCFSSIILQEVPGAEDCRVQAATVILPTRLARMEVGWRIKRLWKMRMTWQFRWPHLDCVTLLAPLLWLPCCLFMSYLAMCGSVATWWSCTLWRLHRYSTLWSLAQLSNPGECLNFSWEQKVWEPLATTCRCMRWFFWVFCSFPFIAMTESWILGDTMLNWVLILQMLFSWKRKTFLILCICCSLSCKNSTLCTVVLIIWFLPYFLGSPQPWQ